MHQGAVTTASFTATHVRLVHPEPILRQALLGKAKILELKKRLRGCLDVLMEISVRFAWFVPALVEKTKLLMALAEWEQVGLVVCLITTYHDIVHYDKAPMLRRWPSGSRWGWAAEAMDGLLM